MIKRIKNYFSKEKDYEEDEYEKEDIYEDESQDGYERFNSNDDKEKGESFNVTDESFSLSSAVNKKFEVLMVSPDTFNDTLKIADDLKKNKMIILNLDDIEFEESRKIVDFLSGTVYALGGSVNKISGKIILFTPIFVGVQNTISLRKKDMGMDVPNFRRS